MPFELDPKYVKRRLRLLDGGSQFPSVQVINSEDSEVAFLNSLEIRRNQLDAEIRDTSSFKAREELKKNRQVVSRGINGVRMVLDERGIKIRKKV